MRRRFPTRFPITLLMLGPLLAGCEALSYDPSIRPDRDSDAIDSDKDASGVRDYKRIDIHRERDGDGY